MKTVSIAAFKSRLVHYIEAVSAEPLVIEKRDAPVAVFISYDEYARLVSLENNFLLQRAKKAEKTGYLGTEKSAELLKSGLNEKP